MNVMMLVHNDSIEPVKLLRKRDTDELNGIGFVDGYEFVTNILNDHVIPYVVLICVVNV
jgi:hypothetical protein